MINFREIDPDAWLRWLAFMGKRWPKELHPLGEQYPDFICYRFKKSHDWIRAYQFGGTYGEPELYVDLFQGRDSIFPGMAMTRVNVREVDPCACGNWLPPTDDQVAIAESRYKKAIMRAKKVLN